MVIGLLIDYIKLQVKVNMKEVYRPQYQGTVGLSGQRGPAHMGPAWGVPSHEGNGCSGHQVLASPSLAHYRSPNSSLPLC